MSTEKKTLWELLWDYDPNGLLVVDTDLKITLVNSALCAMFKTTAEAIVGQPVSVIIDDADDFLTVWDENQPVKARDKHYPACHLYVRKVMFPIRDEGIIACIMVDVTHDRQQRDEMRQAQARDDPARRRSHQQPDAGRAPDRQPAWRDYGGKQG